MSPTLQKSLFTLICLIWVTFVSAISFAGTPEEAARFFISNIKQARTLRALVTINDAENSKLLGQPISEQALIYINLNRGIASMDSISNMHTRVLYKDNALKQSIHFKRDPKQTSSDTPLYPENEVDLLSNDVPVVLSKVLLWITRNPRLFISWEAPSNFGITDSGWAKSWVRLNLPGINQQFFFGFINDGLSTVFIADKTNKLLYAVQVDKLEWDQNIPPEKFNTFRKHPLDETPTPAEKWWRDVYYNK